MNQTDRTCQPFLERNLARILLIDDDALIRETIASILRDARHAVLATDDGLHALELLSQGSFDLVVSDIMMPVMDGIELLRTIRKQHPNLRVLCISGGGRDGHMEYLEMTPALGAHMILAKPFTPSQLYAAIAVTLSMPALPPNLKGDARE